MYSTYTFPARAPSRSQLLRESERGAIQLCNTKWVEVKSRVPQQLLLLERVAHSDESIHALVDVGGGVGGTDLHADACLALQHTHTDA
jgi:hypothetical protein